MKFKLYIKTMRPKSWLKNIFVFIPPVFALSLTDRVKMTSTSIAFVAFCLISSAVYIINDLFDIEKDRKHPVKCKRAIASGEISAKGALIVAILIALAGLSLTVILNIFVMVALIAYVLINVLYFTILKYRPIFDCFCISAGFVLRIYAGSFASGDIVSNWLFLTVIAMSLFMAFGKRRGEMVRVGAENRRAVLEHYDLMFLNGMMFICAGLSVVFYSLWAMNRDANMIYTVPLIIFIICKYLLIVYGSDSHADPTTVITSNRTMLAACAAYAVITIAILYGGHLL